MSLKLPAVLLILITLGCSTFTPNSVKELALEKEILIGKIYTAPSLEDNGKRLLVFLITPDKGIVVAATRNEEEKRILQSINWFPLQTGFAANRIPRGHQMPGCFGEMTLVAV